VAQFGKAFESFATTASFALPHPWGVLGSGLLSVVFMFTGSNEGGKNPLVEALEESLKQMKAIIRAEALEQRMHAAALTIQEELDWIMGKWEILKDLDDDRNSGSGFVQDLLDKLNAVDMPDNPVRRAIDDMAQIVNDDNEDSSDLTIRDSAFEVMINAVSTYLTYLRLRVQLKSWQKLDCGDDLFYAWYDQFIRETEGQVDKVIDALNGLTTATFISLSHQGVSEDKQGDMVDAMFEHVNSGIANWQSNVEDWKDNKPPHVPKKAPSVSSKPEDWVATTPHGPNWVKGTKVRYAVAFKNSSGGTPHGPWTDWVAVTEHAYPLVTDIPTDSLGMAKSRVIYRQFEGKSEAKFGIIADNSTTTYQDNND
jgi:hypothetical protein